MLPCFEVRVRVKGRVKVNVKFLGFGFAECSKVQRRVIISPWCSAQLQSISQLISERPSGHKMEESVQKKFLKIHGYARQVYLNIVVRPFQLLSLFRITGAWQNLSVRVMRNKDNIWNGLI